MDYRRTSVWQSGADPNKAIVEVTIADAVEARTVMWTSNIDELEMHGEKCLLVASEMRRMRGA